MSRDPYPVVAQLHKGANDQPPGPDVWGIFDNYGYWYSTGIGPLQFPVEQAGLAKTVADALNVAHERGRLMAVNRLREALDLQEIE